MAYVNPGFNAMQSQGWKITFKGIITATEVSFRSALTSYSDSFTSNWSREQVYGKMDPIPIFQNTQRVISFGWEAVAADLNEARSMNAGVIQLVSLLYPSYDEFEKAKKGRPAVRLLSGAPVIKIKFANLITDQDNDFLLGTVDNFTHTANLDAGFFTVADPKEIGYNKADKGHLYPKAIRFECKFYPLHTHTLGVRGGPSAAATPWVKTEADEKKLKQDLGKEAYAEYVKKKGLRGHPYETRFPYGDNPKIERVVASEKKKKAAKTPEKGAPPATTEKPAAKAKTNKVTDQ